jgi:hypothetical protein
VVVAPRQSIDADNGHEGTGHASVRGRWFSSPWRGVVVSLFTISGASLPALLVLTLTASDPPMTPDVLIPLFAQWSVLPAAIAVALRASRGAQIEITDSAMVVTLHARRIEVPFEAITGVVPWRVPLPGPGLWLVLRSGRRLGVELPDPTPIIVALADRGVPGAATSRNAPALAHARARALRERRFFERPLFKFVGVGLLPAGILFYTHQHIAYGGLLGEYHLLGLRSWVGSAVTHWAAITVYLVLYASVLRGPAEIVCWIAARVAPPRASGVRRLVEAISQVFYYGGIPLILAIRYTA